MVSTEANERLAIGRRDVALAGLHLPRCVTPTQLPPEQFKRGGLGAQRSHAEVAYLVDLTVDERPA